MRHSPGGTGGAGLGLFYGFAGFTGTLVLIALVALLAVVIVRRRKGLPPLQLPAALRRPQPAMVPSALQLLDERLAHGDIDITDYVSRRAALLGTTTPPSTWTPEPAPGSTA
jgi:uncharacterized membrane protein